MLYNLYYISQIDDLVHAQDLYIGTEGVVLLRLLETKDAQKEIDPSILSGHNAFILALNPTIRNVQLACLCALINSEEDEVTDGSPFLSHVQQRLFLTHLGCNCNRSYYDAYLQESTSPRIYSL